MSELIPLSPPSILRPAQDSGATDRTEPLTCGSARPSRRTSRTAFAAAAPDEDDPLLRFAPYLHKAPRRNSITPDRQRAFIAALAATGIVTEAARAIGASLEALYKLRRLSGAEGFAQAWDQAIDLGVARLEDCALALAIEGEETPIVSGGAMLGTWRKHNFGFIRFLLTQRRGERYSPRPNYAELRPGHPVYERLKAEWVAEEYGDEEESYRAIDAMLDRMRENSEANTRLLEGPDEDDEG